MGKGQHWAIVGPNGAGKSTLLSAILGSILVVKGYIHYDFFEEMRQADKTPANAQVRSYIGVVSVDAFQQLVKKSAGFYQQRYNSQSADSSPTVREVLEIEAQKLADVESPSTLIAEILQLVGIPYAIDRHLVKLSNGETKKLLLAKALLCKPKLLLLDNPYIGLDAQARGQLNDTLNHLIESGTTQIVMATSPDEIPSGFTHVIEVENLQISFLGKRNEWAIREKTIEQTPNYQSIEPPIYLHAQVTSDETVIQLQQVSVSYDGVSVLDNINWVVQQNEKWALLGPNGSGKSSLLSLIVGDNPQAYANEIYLFGRRRGTGESIWDIKKKIGYVSPELQAYYTENSNVRTVIATGLTDTLVLNRKLKDVEHQQIETTMQLTETAQFANRLYKSLSTGEQRLVLLARALVKNPPVLILDEPCQGLDFRWQLRFKQLVEYICKHFDKTLIYVTHYADEIPACVTKILRLRAGKVEHQSSF